MTKRFFIFSLIVTLVTSQVSAQQSCHKPTLEQKASWSSIMVPDLQNYLEWGRSQPIMDLMMVWIVGNIDTLNIKMVIGDIDLVANDQKITNDYGGVQTTLEQWKAVSNAIGKLDGKVPYIASTGNHDYSIDRQRTVFRTTVNSCTSLQIFSIKKHLFEKQ